MPSGVRQTVLPPDIGRACVTAAFRGSRGPTPVPRNCPTMISWLSRSQYWRDLIGCYTRLRRRTRAAGKDRRPLRHHERRRRDRPARSRAGRAAAGLEARLRVGRPTAGRRTATSTRAFSKTVLPLPYHGMADLRDAARPPGGRPRLSAVPRRTGRSIIRATSRRAVFERGLRPRIDRDNQETNVRSVLKQILFLFILAGLLAAAFALDRRRRGPATRPSTARPPCKTTASISKRSAVSAASISSTTGRRGSTPSSSTSCRSDRRDGGVGFGRRFRPRRLARPVRDQRRRGRQVRLYRNQHDGTFRDVAEEVGLADLNQEGTGVSHGRRLGRLRQ